MALPAADLETNRKPHPSKVHAWAQAWQHVADQSGNPEHHALAARASFKAAKYHSVFGKPEDALHCWQRGLHHHQQATKAGHADGTMQEVNDMLPALKRHMNEVQEAGSGW